MMEEHGTSKTFLTVEDFLRLPDDGYKYELVDGEKKVCPAGIEHESIGVRLIADLQIFSKQRHLGVVCGSSAGYKLPNGRVRSPDVSFIKKERLPDGKPPKGFADFLPDLAVEIISPNDDVQNIGEKIGEYLKFGVTLIWLIDPEKQRVTVYRSLTDVEVKKKEDVISGEDILPGFECKVGELFDES